MSESKDKPVRNRMTIAMSDEDKKLVKKLAVERDITVAQLFHDMLIRECDADSLPKIKSEDKED